MQPLLFSVAEATDTLFHYVDPTHLQNLMNFSKETLIKLSIVDTSQTIHLRVTQHE